jgi:hypothetical protein
MGELNKRLDEDNCPQNLPSLRADKRERSRFRPNFPVEQRVKSDEVFDLL